jgi:hydrogenase maturation factor
MSQAATAPSALGKISPEIFARVIAPHLGAARGEVVAGPREGHDAAVIRIGAGRVLAVTTDPLSLIPALGPERSARLACHLIASDLWTTGIPPAYASIDFNLPAVVTGHTGCYEGCAPSIIGAATLIGVGDEGRFVTPAMAAPGDRVIVTKGCAIETAAIAAALCPKRLAERLDEDAMARLRALEARVSVVADCRAALRVGVHEHGVTALHDATEGGILGGLVELARACGHDVRVDRGRIPLADEVRVACEVLGVDPYVTLAEGALIVCANAARAANVLAALTDENIPAADVGEVMKGSGRLWIGEDGGGVTTLDAPPADPYWAAYSRAVSEGWA